MKPRYPVPPHPHLDNPKPERPKKVDGPAMRVKSDFQAITGGTLMKMLGRFFVFEYEHAGHGKCQLLGKILGGDIVAGTVSLQVSSGEMNSHRGHMVKSIERKGDGKWVLKYFVPTYPSRSQWPAPAPVVCEMPGELELL